MRETSLQFIPEKKAINQKVVEALKKEWKDFFVDDEYFKGFFWKTRNTRQGVVFIPLAAFGEIDKDSKLTQLDMLQKKMRGAYAERYNYKLIGVLEVYKTLSKKGFDNGWQDLKWGKAAGTGNLRCKELWLAIQYYLGPKIIHKRHFNNNQLK